MRQEPNIRSGRNVLGAGLVILLGTEEGRGPRLRVSWEVTAGFSIKISTGGEAGGTAFPNNGEHAQSDGRRSTC